MTAESRTWQQEGKGKMKIRKIGFYQVPTVATTIHKVAGFSEDLIIVDVNADLSTDLCIGQFFYVLLSRPRQFRPLLSQSSLEDDADF